MFRLRSSAACGPNRQAALERAPTLVRIVQGQSGARPAGPLPSIAVRSWGRSLGRRPRSASPSGSRDSCRLAPCLPAQRPHRATSQRAPSFVEPPRPSALEPERAAIVPWVFNEGGREISSFRAACRVRSRTCARSPRPRSEAHRGPSAHSCRRAGRRHDAVVGLEDEGYARPLHRREPGRPCRTRPTTRDVPASGEPARNGWSGCGQAISI